MTIYMGPMTVSLYFVLIPISFIDTSIRPYILACSLPHQLFILSAKFASILPFFVYMSILYDSFVELSNIFTCIDICVMNIFSRTSYSIMSELTLIYVTILMIEDSLPMGLISVPGTFILGPIRPYLEPEPLFV